jgi:aminodeoxyfutalosine synthase
MIDFVRRSSLAPILEKVEAGERLSVEEGAALYRSNDLLALGAMANLVRERLHGDNTYYVRNQHINPTNICYAGCTFCAFAKPARGPGAYRMSIEAVERAARERLDEPIREVHIVGGLDPGAPYDYYLDAVSAVKRVRPDVNVKAYTCVEVAYFAKRFKRSVPQVLRDLVDAGLDSMPGGGAEIFADRVRREICPGKADADEWLEIARTAHNMGIRSNATMLYGHIETPEERADHLDSLRRLQDETGGFLAFIPLAFHPENTGLAHLSPPTGIDDLKNIAIARLMLDNFDHIKAYWIMISPKVAQVSLAFGADDLDGTVVQEKIVHDAGAKTPQEVTERDLVRLIRDAGRIPIERDALYNFV